MNQEFCTLAAAVFGEPWQSKLARAFKVNVRTVRRWASGESRVPENIILALEIMKKDKKNGD